MQHSQLTLLRRVGRFLTVLLAPRTRQSHLHLQMEALEGLQQFVAFTVNFGQPKKVKMLDPSGCFYFTEPRVVVLVLLG